MSGTLPQGPEIQSDKSRLIHSLEAAVGQGKRLDGGVAVGRDDQRTVDVSHGAEGHVYHL